MSLSTLRPTNISWVLVQGCVCPRSDSVCIRPEDYTKPVECLNAAHLGSFADHLMEKPCAAHGNNNNNNNVLMILFGLMLLIVQICIFWLLFISQRRNTAPTNRTRSGASGANVPLRRLPSPLSVGRKLRAELGIASGSGGPRESAEKGVEEGVEVHSDD